MSFNELVLEVADIAGRSEAALKVSPEVAAKAMADIAQIARQVMDAIDEEREREAAMVAELEGRYDAQFDAISANWGHD